MKHPDVTLPIGVEGVYTKHNLSQIGSSEAEDLIQACQFRLNEIMAAHLEQFGFACRVRAHDFLFRYVMVQLPDSPLPGEWATLAECQRLIDTARNLPIQEAFERWREKVEQIESPEYTRADALRDMQAERNQARADYQAGKIDAEDLRLRHQSAREYLSYIGSKTSEKKAASSRKNGLLGGRPKKTD